MQKQVLIVGLGRFGMSLAKALSSRGVEILAVDRKPERVDSVAAFAAEAIVLDATSEEDLSKVRPADRDLCVCAIGDESSEASILCTALLRQLGGRRIVARANSPLQGRILKLVGAHEVINPLEEFGARFADQFAFERLKGELPLGGDLVVAEVQPPEEFVGKTLSELKLPARFSVTIVATRRAGAPDVHLPTPDQKVEADDIMIVVARKSAIARLVGASR
ncbi:MAG: TrkA family potassium uptake protein [Acidobacteria bacterium]|nr:TrkA family potassium uptake protein [Acidobacteriota bacterium]